MAPDGEVTREEEVKQVRVGKPHVVVLGAGASMACMPNGDRRGRPLPDMKGLASLESIASLFRAAGHQLPVDDFEAAYAKLREEEADELADRVDRTVHEYFSEIEITNEATIYDHLLLSLRPKDLIATFNWDPLLVQAHRRLARRGIDALPHMVFLHGNVAVGACDDHDVVGEIGVRCPDCSRLLSAVPLLYPVTEKNYESEKYIADAWADLRQGLENAFMVTIFGYRAPRSDVAAIKEFKRAWGTWEDRQFEQFEIIGRPGADPDALRARWDDFIHTHHYRVHGDFFDSWLANHPRRSGEAYVNQHIEAKFIDTNPVTTSTDFDAVVAWYQELINVERESAKTGG